MPSRNNEIQQVFFLLDRMFDNVDEQLTDTVNALFGGDVRLAHHVQELDRRVDALELEIDQECELILSTLRPEDLSLRMVIAAMRITADLERIGDLCKNVAKKITYVRDSSEWRSRTHIIDMADTVRTILRDTRDAFTERDRLKARQVLAYDRRVDRAYREVIDSIISLCRSHPEMAGALVHLVTVGKALERIADHAKSIARSVVYFIEGVDIRHRKLQASRDTLASLP